MTEDVFQEVEFRVLMSLRRIIRAVDIHSRKLHSELNITAPQLICLYALEKDGPSTLSALASAVTLGLSTVNGIVDRLESKGLVVRERDTHDRRKVFVRQTEYGQEFTKAAPSLLQDRLSQSLKHLPQLEQIAIAMSLERVVGLMEAENLDASPNLITQITESDTGK
ncbi:MAG: winged helix-turn-helix transcriptional regulator [Desulfatibacillum sp.]|nr:winged helix-turn-helix transcriptional regulator [Desulfatibacillum sp.]